MKIEQRIKKIEKKIIVPNVPKYHLVFEEPGNRGEDAIAKYKTENDVDPNDKFIVIRFVTSKRKDEI